MHLQIKIDSINIQYVVTSATRGSTHEVSDIESHYFILQTHSSGIQKKTKIPEGSLTAKQNKGFGSVWANHALGHWTKPPKIREILHQTKQSGNWTTCLRPQKKNTTQNIQLNIMRVKVVTGTDTVYSQLSRHS